MEREAGERAVRLAILDRDADLISALRESGASRGWESHALRRPVGGRQLAGMGIDALILDPVAIGPNPWSWVRDLGARLPDLALVVCTADSTVDERIEALALGIDDWLVKPADPDELIARVDRAVRRARRLAESPTGEEPVLAAELEIDQRRGQVFAAGASAALTRREYEVLAAIVQADGAVVAREEIFRRVWGYAMSSSDRSVDVYVGKLRAKLARVSPAYSYVHTHHRVGYRFEASPLAAATKPAGEGT